VEVTPLIKEEINEKVSSRRTILKDIFYGN